MEPVRGLQPERRVRAPTRLDWEFVAGRGQALPVGYDSRRQRYQLFVPPTYTAKRRWPVVIFVSPGDDPLGWDAWGKPCERAGWLFAAPYGAGNTCPLAQRVRAVLDILDDVRQHYQIDPDRTYLAGMGESAAVACRIAQALPDHFAGVVLIGGTAELPALDYLRHRLEQRLSIALVCGTADPAREQVERYLTPLYRDLGVRSRLWMVADLGRRLPPSRILEVVQGWLDADLRRREQDRRDDVLGPEEAPRRRLLGQRAVERAERLLRAGDHLHRAASLLEWTVTRCGRTEAGERARELLADLSVPGVRQRRLLEQRAADHRRVLTVRAAAWEKAGQFATARRSWLDVARLPLPPEEQKKAREQADRLAGLMARRPYLGLTLSGDTTEIQAVLPDGPAAKAGLRAGDRIVQMNGKPVADLDGVRQVVDRSKPGDTLALNVQRGMLDVLIVLRVAPLPVEKE